MWNDEQNSKTIYNVSNDGQFLVHVNFNLLKWRTNETFLIWFDELLMFLSSTGLFLSLSAEDKSLS